MLSLTPLRNFSGRETGQSVLLASLLVEMNAVEAQFIIQMEEIRVQTIVEFQNFPRLQWKAQSVRQVQETYLI